MDHMIKEKFIVTDGEKVTDEIYRVTGLDIEIDQIIENISSEESNIYFFSDNNINSEHYFSKKFCFNIIFGINDNQSLF